MIVVSVIHFVILRASSLLTPNFSLTFLSRNDHQSIKNNSTTSSFFFPSVPLQYFVSNCNSKSCILSSSSIHLKSLLQVHFTFNFISQLLYKALSSITFFSKFILNFYMNLHISFQGNIISFKFLVSGNDFLHFFTLNF